MAIMANAGEDFVTVYAAFMQEFRNETRDMPRYRRLEAKVNSMFARMNDNERIENVKKLAEKGLVPDTWLVMQSVFNGTFTKIY